MPDSNPPTGEQTAPPQAWSALVDLDKPRELPDRPDPLDPLAADPDPEPDKAKSSGPVAISEDFFDFDSVFGVDEPAQPAASPAVVVGTVQVLRRWVLMVALIGVWIPAAAAGIGLYQWWTAASSESLPLFGVVVYVVITVVAGLLLSMVENRPWVSAMAISLLTASFAAVTAAAAWHWIQGF